MSGVSEVRFTVLTLFPEAFGAIQATSLFGRAIQAGRLQVQVTDIRDFAEGKHRVVDDTPYGGGAGMVMKVEPVAAAIADVRRQDPGVEVALLSPQGEPLNQRLVEQLAGFEHLALVCGRYEGVDERVRARVDREICIGDFVLSGGEPAAWVVMDAVARFVPGVLGCPDSLTEESFSRPGLLEYPHYTRPRQFEGVAVPEVLLSGDHAAIAAWRHRQAVLRTARRRPDLIEQHGLTDEERTWLEEELASDGDA